MLVHTILAFVSGTALSLSHGVAQPTKSAPTPDATHGAKLVQSKDALGLLTESRQVRGTLQSSDPRLGDGSHFDVHTATFSAGQRVRIDLRSDAFDAYLMVLRTTPDGTELVADNDDAGGSIDAHVEFTVRQAGTYQIVANSTYPEETGDYTLSIDLAGGGTGSVAPQPNAAGSAIGEAHRGRLIPGQSPRLDDNSLFDTVAFEGRRGDRIELLLESAEFDPVLALYHESDGTLELLTGDDDSGGGSSSLIRIRLPYTGRYVALVNAYSAEGAGGYELTINSVGNATESPADENWAARYPGGGDPNERYAVLVGIDDYPGVRSDLASCVVDTREMRRVLVDVLGFEESNIVIINDAEATRDHIITAIRQHLGQAGPGGAAMFYYSGHGMQVGANLGQQDDEPDDNDEALYVWGQTDRSSVILDEEIGRLVSDLNAGGRMVILDSCHSGTGTLGPSYKWVDPSDPWIADRLSLPEKYLEGNARSTSTQDLLDGPSDHILFAACSSSQVASAGFGGRPSVFTYFLVREIERAGSDVSFRELESRVKAAVEAYRRSNTSVVQVPQLEGRKIEGSLRQYFRIGN